MSGAWIVAAKLPGMTNEASAPSAIAPALHYYRTSCTYAHAPYLRPCRQSYRSLLTPLTYVRVGKSVFGLSKCHSGQTVRFWGGRFISGIGTNADEMCGLTGLQS